MKNDLFDWIDADGRFRLTLTPRPPGGRQVDLAMKAYRTYGLDVVVSLQPEDEAARCGLEREADAAVLAGLEFVRFPIEDHGVPTDRDAIIACADALLAKLEAGQSVLLHCFAGIGRSGLLAILILMRAGFSYDDAAYRAMQARRLRVPETDEQHAWLKALKPPEEPT